MRQVVNCRMNFFDWLIVLQSQEGEGMGRTACSMDWGEVPALSHLICCWQLLHFFCHFKFSPSSSTLRLDQVFDQLRRKELQTLGNRLKCTVFK